jgi:hypothetical protein
LQLQTQTINADQKIKKTSDRTNTVVLTKATPEVTVRYHVKSGTLAHKNNNPFNLKYAGQTGATKAKSGGFAMFKTVKDGVRAGYRQIALDADRGHTVGTFLAKYAPPSENNTSAYLNFICTSMDITADQKMDDPLFDLHRLGIYMMRMESNTRQEYVHNETN